MQVLLHPAQANFGYFLTWFQYLQLPSKLLTEFLIFSYFDPD
jgi:hypothetical protein